MNLSKGELCAVCLQHPASDELLWVGHEIPACAHCKAIREHGDYRPMQEIERERRAHASLIN